VRRGCRALASRCFSCFRRGGFGSGGCGIPEFAGSNCNQLAVWRVVSDERGSFCPDAPISKQAYCCPDSPWQFVVAALRVWLGGHFSAGGLRLGCRKPGVSHCRSRHCGVSRDWRRSLSCSGPAGEMSAVPGKGALFAEVHPACARPQGHGKPSVESGLRGVVFRSVPVSVLRRGVRLRGAETAARALRDGRTSCPRAGKPHPFVSMNPRRLVESSQGAGKDDCRRDHRRDGIRIISSFGEGK